MLHFADSVLARQRQDQMQAPKRAGNDHTIAWWKDCNCDSRLARVWSVARCVLNGTLKSLFGLSVWPCHGQARARVQTLHSLGKQCT